MATESAQGAVRVTDDENLTLVTEVGSSDLHAYRVVARGELDLYTAPQLATALESLIADGARMVVLDASNVVFLDSSGLRAIVSCATKLSAAGGRLVIEGMSGAVQRVLEISGLIEHYRA